MKWLQEEILSKPMHKDVNKRKALTMQFSKESVMDEPKKQLSEKENLTEQLGQSLLVKVGDYEHRIVELTKKVFILLFLFRFSVIVKVEEDEKNIQRLADFQSEAALWKEVIKTQPPYFI